MKNLKKEKSMATPPLKWTGKNTYNNDVFVDFNKKTVRFNPVKITGPYYLFGLFLFNLFAVCGLLLFFFLYLPMYTLMLVSYQDYNILILGTIYACSLVIILHIYGWLYFYNKHFQEWIFPKLNALLINLTTRFLTFGIQGAKKKMRVNPLAIQNRMIIIPHFANVELKWNATKDFSKYLSTIDVRHIFLNSEWKFYAIFKFKKTPKKGMIEIEYI